MTAHLQARFRLMPNRPVAPMALCAIGVMATLLAPGPSYGQWTKTIDCAEGRSKVLLTVRRLEHDRCLSQCL